MKIALLLFGLGLVACSIMKCLWGGDAESEADRHHNEAVNFRKDTKEGEHK